MKTTLAAAFAAAMALGTLAQAQTAEDAFGIWLNPENKSQTEFYKCGDGVCAKIVKVTDGQKTDDKNPDAAKRSRPIVGLVIMQGAKKTGARQWAGNLYNRADGKSYAGTAHGQEQGRGRSGRLRGRRVLPDDDLHPREVALPAFDAFAVRGPGRSGLGRTLRMAVPACLHGAQYCCGRGAPRARCALQNAAAMCHYLHTVDCGSGLVTPSPGEPGGRHAGLR